MNLLDKLKQRKIVQWGLAYLAAAWLLMQLVDVLGSRWGVTDALLADPRYTAIVEGAGMQNYLSN